MYDKFGEFDSCEEINRAAAAQKAEGDKEALEILAKENGIDREDMEDFWDGTIEELCTPTSAAMAKIELEAEALGLFGVFELWKGLLTDAVLKEPEIAVAVRKKGKNLKDALAAVLKLESKGRQAIPEAIAKAAGIPASTQMSTMTLQEQKKAILAYYLGGKK